MVGKQTSLHKNAFYLLGATTRDNRHRIVQLAEEKSLILDSHICTKVRSDLTNPRNRLAAEIAWLPGLSPRRTHELLSALDQDIDSLKGQTTLPFLANANLLAAAFELLDPEMDDFDWSDWVWDFAKTVDVIDLEDVMRDINEDRAISGFPEVQTIDAIESALTERRRYYKKAIKEALNKLSPLQIANVLTMVVDTSTNSGEDHAPLLIDELIDSYETDTQSYLQKEAENIKELTNAARPAAKRGEQAVNPLIDRIDVVLRKWDLIAQPIQLSMKARGIDHTLSHELAREVRSLGVDLFNEHGMLNQAQRLLDLTQEVFAELPEIVEKLSEDATTLEDIAKRNRLNNLLDPIHKMCTVAVDASEKNPLIAAQEGNRVLEAAPQLIFNLERTEATGTIVSQGKDEVALTLMNCAIMYGNKTEKWKPCLVLLEASLNIASGSDVKNRVAKNLEIVRKNEKAFKDIEPISSAPSLSTINGIGFSLYGATDNDRETGSYLSTYYFTFFFIPIFPICRYRVISTATGYRFLGKAPLRNFDKWHIAIFIGIILLIIANMK
jgi:hypothetical protein